MMSMGKTKLSITDKFSLLAIIFTIFCGSVVIIGWFFNIPIMMRLLPFLMPMKANAALCFVFIGGALFLSNYLPSTLNSTMLTFFLYIGRILAVLAGIFGLLTVAEYAFGLNFGIDDFIFPAIVKNDATELNQMLIKLDGAFPTRIKLEAAFCYVLLSIATLLRSDKNHWRIVSASLGLSVLAISLASLSSFLTPELGQFGWFGYGVMRMNAAILLALLGGVVVFIAWQRNVLSWSLGKGTTLAFIFGLFLLVVIGFNSSRIQFWINDTNYQITLNENIISHVDEVLADVSNTQSNVRGYVITGNERFHKAFFNAKKDSLVKLAALQTIISAKPVYQKYFLDIKDSLNEQLVWYQYVVDARNNNVPIANETIFHGSDLSDKMRVVIFKIKNEISQHVLRLKQEFDNVSSVSNLLICLGTLLSGGVFLAIVFVLNGTESRRREVEKDLQKAKDVAESLVRSKSDFLANMSHEIRTPMNAIIGLSQIALDKTMSEELRDHLDKINKASESLMGILNDILDFSKIEAGKFTINNSYFDLNILVTRLHDLFLIRASEKHLSFLVENDSLISGRLFGDVLRLQQVLSNLLGNAIKFTDSGKILLKTKLLEKSGLKANIRFSVTDTGIGIAQEDMLELFKPFTQIKASPASQFGGTGLGLAISSNLLKNMGSSLNLESSVGNGTTFFFDLCFDLDLSMPVLQKNSEVKPSKPGNLAAEVKEQGMLLNGKHILLAEDNEINQMVIKEFLKFASVSLDVAYNGKEVLSLLKENKYDAILMDVQMPEMGGLEATQLIRLQPEFKDIPIIALTAGVTEGEREKCFSCGMNDIVAKPVRPKELIRVLCNRLGITTNSR